MSRDQPASLMEEARAEAARLSAAAKGMRKPLRKTQGTQTTEPGLEELVALKKEVAAQAAELVMLREELPRIQLASERHASEEVHASSLERDERWSARVRHLQRAHQQALDHARAAAEAQTANELAKQKDALQRQLGEAQARQPVENAVYLCDDSASAARVEALKAQGAPADPGAQPEQLKACCGRRSSPPAGPKLRMLPFFRCRRDSSRRRARHCRRRRERWSCSARSLGCCRRP